MTKLSELSQLMKADWDRRVDHDYRFWMSDGWSSDEVMWQSGERDLSILLQDLELSKHKSFLEIGCGVGRLLRAASKKFDSVSGIDVSEKAIEKAKTLLADTENVQCITGNGLDLSQFADASLDCVVSFAALTSIPTEIIACYLLEMHRVLASDGVIRLQVYLGQEQAVRKNDTLHLRCFRPEHFSKAMEQAGLNVEWIRELELPFQVSFKEVGIEAVIVSLRKGGEPKSDSHTIAKTLLPEGEKEATEIIDGDALEYWMTVNYAQELASQGDDEKAKDALAYAEVVTRTMSIDVQDSLQTLADRISGISSTDYLGQSELPSPHSSDVFQKNMRVLSDKFPRIAEKVKSFSGGLDDIEIRTTTEGVALFMNGQCFDHPTKPVAAGHNWCRQALQSQRIKDANSVVIFGFACGYHVESVMQAFSGAVSAVEPSVELFVSALGARDLTECLLRLENLGVGTDEVYQGFNEGSELLVRPQSQAIFSEYYRSLRSNFYGVRGLAALQPKIAVLGPIMGGTLPIMGYSALALQLLNQRVREIDMSGFAQGYAEFSKLIGNDTLKANAISSYVETLSTAIVQSVTEKPIDILICMAQAPISADALTELRKRGVVTVLWFVEDYLRFTTWQQLAPYYDFIFTIQRGDCITAIQNAGCSEVHYLPTACAPLVHSPMNLSAEEQERWGSPVSFVGAGYHNRQQMFASLANYPFKIWGTEWPTCRPFDRLVQEEGRRLKPDEYVRIFNSSKINLNLHSSTERDGIDPKGDFLNPRTFELASCGAFQLADPRSLMEEVFTPGKDIVTFDSNENLKQKIDYYLENEEERQKIAQAGRETVLQNHTYQHRLKEMLSVIYSSKYEQIKSRQGENPWRKIIQVAKKFPELEERCKKAHERGEEASLDALVSDVVTGQGELNDVEMKLLFLFHVSKQIIRHKKEESGG